MNENSRRLFFVLMFGLVFYVAGASFVQSFVNYPTWHLIGYSEFQTYHKAMSSRIILFMVMPWLVEVLLTFVLMRFRPRSIPLFVIEFAQGFNLIAIVSTIFVQLPIQIQLEHSGLSADAVRELIETDSVRWVSVILKLALYLWMMSRIVNGKSHVSARSDTEQPSAAII